MAKPVGPYTPIVRAGDFLYASGQIGLDAAGDLVDGFEAQARRSIGNLVALLEGEGAGLANVVKTTVFVTDMGEYAAMNEIYVELFGDSRPARSAVAVADLPKGALFEIEAIAYVG
jgi:2-iminobutanoate/2-iminopropanoate deaminase